LVFYGKERKKMKYTIAVGNISNGIELFGLYDSIVEAMNNAASFVTNLDWVIMNIGSQEDLEDL
jgi:hypothetical protein